MYNSTAFFSFWSNLNVLSHTCQCQTCLTATKTSFLQSNKINVHLKLFLPTTNYEVVLLKIKLQINRELKNIYSIKFNVGQFARVKMTFSDDPTNSGNWQL
jgi:hypothetical protein